MFSQKGQTVEEQKKTLPQVAEDMRDLIGRFDGDAAMSARSSYKAMVRAFGEPCEVVEGTVQVLPKSRIDSMQNPWDPDATDDGHQGPGCQVQIAETCGDGEVQLITGALVQTACAHDANALQPVLERLQEQGLLPESMMADTSYGSDANVQFAAELGVELVSPVSGPSGEEKGAASVATAEVPASIEPLSIDDFAVDERTGTVEACPSGKVPLTVLHDAETPTTTIEMKADDCSGCPYFDACPMKLKGTKYEMSDTDKQRRLDERRREQETKPFRERDAKRSGIESTNSGLKRRMGLGELRVRGMKGVAHALYLRIAGWNMLRASQSAGLMAKIRAILAQRGLLGRLLARQFASRLKNAMKWLTTAAKMPALALRTIR